MTQRHAHLALASLAAMRPSAENTVRHGAFWDTVEYNGATGHDKLELFRVPQGGLFSAGVQKTAEHTNLKYAGMMEQGKAIFVTGIQLIFLPGVAVGRIAAAAKFDRSNDLQAFSERGLLKISVNGNDVIEDGPLGLFPGETRLIGEGNSYADSFTADDNKAGVLELTTLGGKSYSNFEPFPWLSGQSIDASLNWFTSKVVMPSGQNGRVIARLTGSVYRVQNVVNG